jgi:ATP-dependent protease ClpP protease subunit
MSKLTKEDLEVFEDRLKNREIWINGPIDERLVNRAIVHVVKWNQEDQEVKTPKTIKVYINSQGGQVTVTRAFINVLLNAKAEVETYNMGWCLSAGFYIFLAGKRRYSSKDAAFMVHGPSISGEMYFGYQELINYSSYIHKSANRLIEYVIERTGMSEKDATECIESDLWMLGDEAKEKKIVTHFL